MRFSFIPLCSVALLLAVAIDAKAQSSPPVESEKAAPIARPEDVSSMDAILAAVYDVISGPAGKKRDWDRMRSLFLPGARLIGAGRRSDGTIGHRLMTPEDYIRLSGPVLEERGFFEKEIARHVDQYGGIAQVFSTYEARASLDDPKPMQRGINSIQLLNDGKRWWIVTIYWQTEDPTTPIPASFGGALTG